MRNWINKKLNKIEIILLILVILLQVIVRVDVGKKKLYIHIDEGYSYGLMNYKKVDIISNDDFYNTWHNSEYYTDYLTISEVERWNFFSVYENQKNDVHPPFYYLMLRIAALFTVEEFSKWTGIVLNILIFIMTSIMVYKISQIIFKNKLYAVLIVLINGFTIASVETTIFIRMYALSALNFLIVVYSHIKNYHKYELELKDMGLMGIIIIIGALTHYYYLVFILVLYIMYMVHFIKRKNISNAIRYTITMVISGIVYLLIFPYAVIHVFMGYRGKGVVSKLRSFTTMWDSLGGYIRILNEEVFNGIFLLFIVFASIYILIKIVKNKIIMISFKNRELFLILTPTLVYFIIIACVSPYQEIRYIMPICPGIVITIMYIIKNLLRRMLSTNQTFITMNIVFIMMLCIPIIKNIEVNYIYSDMNWIVKNTEEYRHLPTLYVLDKNNNRFMDDLYLFTKIEKSYILDSELFSKQKIDEIFKDIDTKNGVRIIISEGLSQTEQIYEIMEVINKNSFNELKKMNACTIYLIE